MGNESGTWIMYGVDWDDPECIHTVDEAIEYIKKIMVNFIEDKMDSEILSNQLKVIAGFGKDGEKGFEGAVTTSDKQIRKVLK